MEPLKGGRLANPPAEALEIMRSSGVDRTPVDWALQFLWNRPEVAVVLSGMGSQQMVDDNCASADRSGVGTLTPHELDIGRATRRGLSPPHGRAVHRLPLLHALPVGRGHPPELRHLEQRVHEGRRLAELEHQAQLSSKLARTPAKVNLEDPNGSAAMCTKCGQVRPEVPAGNRHPHRTREVRGGAAVACGSEQPAQAGRRRLREARQPG